MHFNIGDEVLVIGPSISGRQLCEGETFEIETTELNNYTAIGFPWYPASSLKLVEPELKIGDFVEVIGPTEYGSDKWQGKIFEITTTHKESPVLGGRDLFSAINAAWYPAKSLRKLTPEEVAKHLAPPTNTPQNQFNEKTDARLSAIEKQQKEQYKKISQFDGEISHLIGSIQECLMESGDVEARTRCREIAIEKCQRESSLDIDNHRLSHEKWRDRILAIEERLASIEQRLSSLERSQNGQSKYLVMKQWVAGP